MRERADFGSLISAFGGGGDRGNMFPQSDADDLRKGARFIPGEVTLTRREGKVVKFVKNCGPCCWYWELPDGTRVYHWDRPTFEAIGRNNNPVGWGTHSTVAGPCPDCGNEHTNGGTVPPS